MLAQRIATFAAHALDIQTRRSRRIAQIALASLLAVALFPSVHAEKTNQPTSSPDVGLLARIHFNTQTADFEKARAFYHRLGFTTGIGGFPKTNTYRMAESLGMYDICTYEIEDIEVINIPGSWGPTNIDLIQFAVPFNPAPPYPSTHHLGMAYAALLTTDLEADYAALKEDGVQFLSEPYGVPGNRFVFFTDPDGVFYKLVEQTPPHALPDQASRLTHIIGMPYIGINVSDLDKALAFYQQLGYTASRALPASIGKAEAQAYGLDRAYRVRGVDVALPHGDRHVLRLLEWVEGPRQAPYPAPISHIGIHRIALAVSNLDQAVTDLRQAGVQFLSEIAPCCSGTGKDEQGIINAIDPDGIFVELVGPIKQRPWIDPPEQCR